MLLQPPSAEGEIVSEAGHAAAEGAAAGSEPEVIAKGKKDEEGEGKEAAGKDKQ